MQPSWTRQWIDVAYADSSGDESEDDTDRSLSPCTIFGGPPSEDKYALFLQYYSQMRLDQQDTEGKALVLVNMARKEVGLRRPLVLAREEPTRNSSQVTNQEREHKSVPLEDEAMHTGKGESTEQGSEAEAEEIEERMPLLNPNPSNGEYSEFSDNHSAQAALLDLMEIDDFTSSLIRDTSNPPDQKAPSPSLLKDLSSPSKTLDNDIPSLADFHWNIQRQHAANHSIGSDSTIGAAASAPQSTGAVYGIPPPPQTIPNGPLSIYDLDGILVPEGVDTAHLREALERWKQIEMLKSGKYSRRPRRGVDSNLETARAKIAMELLGADTLLVS